MTCEELAAAYWAERDANGLTAEAQRLQVKWYKQCHESESGGGGTTEPPKPPH